MINSNRRLLVSALLLLPGPLACNGAVGSDPSGGGGSGGIVTSSSGGSVGIGGITGAGGYSVGGTQIGAGGISGNLACPGEVHAAYRGTPATAPGTVEAEDFDVEGYEDSTPGNEGTAYRADADVDIKEQGGGFVVGWMTTGEWLEYTIDVPVTGNYGLTIRAGAVDVGRTLDFSLCGTALSAPIAVPQIADWNEVGTSNAVMVHLDAGLQVLRVTVGGGDYVDFDSFAFSGGLDGSGGATGSGGANGSGGASGGTGSGGSTGTVPKFVGNITTYDSVDTDGLVYSEYWDQLTPENAGKWGSVQSSAGSTRNWSSLDSYYDYTQDKGIIFKEHTFVWGPQQPSGSISEQEVKGWMADFCQRYPNTKLIDVVNEPPPHTEPSYADAIGGGTNGNWQWITNAFKWAREACPGKILILNDYNNIEWSDQTDHFIDIVNAVLDAGGPIDAVGAQAHGLSGTQVSDATMKTLVTRLHDETGLPVYITEYDIDDDSDASQLAEYQAHLPFFLETEWIHGVTIWGWIHGKTWVTNSGLIRNGSPRSAMTWLMNELGRPVPP